MLTTVGPLVSNPIRVPSSPVPRSRLGFGPVPVFADTLVKGDITYERQPVYKSVLTIQTGGITAKVRDVYLASGRLKIHIALNQLLVQLEVAFSPGLGPSTGVGGGRMAEQSGNHQCGRYEPVHPTAPLRFSCSTMHSRLHC